MSGLEQFKPVLSNGQLYCYSSSILEVVKEEGNPVGVGLRIKMESRDKEVKLDWGKRVKEYLTVSSFSQIP